MKISEKGFDILFYNLVTCGIVLIPIVCLLWMNVIQLPNGKTFARAITLGYNMLALAFCYLCYRRT